MPDNMDFLLILQAFFRADHIRHCVSTSGHYRPPLYLIALDSVSHLLILVNASANFIIYCILSTHFQVTFTDLDIATIALFFYSPCLFLKSNSARENCLNKRNMKFSNIGRSKWQNFFPIPRFFVHTQMIQYKMVQSISDLPPTVHVRYRCQQSPRSQGRAMIFTVQYLLSRKWKRVVIRRPLWRKIQMTNCENQRDFRHHSGVDEDNNTTAWFIAGSSSRSSLPTAAFSSAPPHNGVLPRRQTFDEAAGDVRIFVNGNALRERDASR